MNYNVWYIARCFEISVDTTGNMIFFLKCDDSTSKANPVQDQAPVKSSVINSN